MSLSLGLHIPWLGGGGGRTLTRQAPSSDGRPEARMLAEGSVLGFVRIHFPLPCRIWVVVIVAGLSSQTWLAESMD